MTPPPRFLARLVARLLPDRVRDVVLGDLLEEFEDVRRRRSVLASTIWYGTAGLSVVAHYAVRGRLGGPDSAGDVRLAARRLVRTPGFTLLAVSGIGLAVGANLVTLSLADGVLLADLPFPASERLGLLTYDFSGSDSDGFGVGYRDLVDVKEAGTAFESVSAVLDWVYVNRSGDGPPQRLAASFVAPGYLEMLGASVVLGRTFGAEENRPGGAAAVVLLSRAFWQQEFGGDPAVIGRTVHLNGMAAAVVGVLDGERSDLRQRFGTAADVYLPLFSAETLLGQDLEDDRGAGPLNGLVRLRPGVDFAQARQELGEISRRLSASHPETNEGWTLHLDPLGEVFYAELRAPVAVLLGGALLVFLLVGFNVAGLLLVRALGRRHEVVVRRALGAPAGRVLRLSLAEAALLAGAGGGLGFLLGWMGTRTLSASPLLTLPSFAPLELTGPAVAATALFLVLLTGAIGAAAWAPLGSVSAARLVGHGNCATANPSTRRLRSAFVVGEVGFAFALLVVAGLLVQSFATLRNMDPGFDTERLMTLQLELRGAPYDVEGTRRTMAASLAELSRSLPGVDDAFLWSPNGVGEGSWVDLLTRESRWDLHPRERLEASRHHLHPGTLGRAGIRIIEGRDVSASDDASSPFVALVSESLARRLWPGEEAVGKSLESRPGGELRVRRVIGVVEDVRHRGRLAEPFSPQLDVYYPFAQWPQRQLTVAVRTAPSVDAATVASELREGVRALDPTLPLYDLATMADRLREEEARARLTTAIVFAYAVLAALLASLGIFGVLAESVRDRTREIGVRMALGARSGQVMGGVARHGLAALLPGAALGLALLLAGGRLVEGALYGTVVWDTRVIVSAGLLLLVVGVAASAVPAVRAARVDPRKAIEDG